jgi:5-methylcytosine-specific restriction endonuclease McrA
VTSWVPARDRLRSINANGKRRAREFGCFVEDVGTDEILQKLEDRAFAWTGYRCYLCGKPVESDKAWHLDHLHPLALGGGHRLENLEMACQDCNIFKAVMPLHEYLDRSGWSGLRPLFKHLRLSERPVEELWSRDRQLATAFARRPREVPAILKWRADTREVERVIVGALLRTGDPYRALTVVPELSQHPRTPEGGALRDNYWRALMGLLPQRGDRRRVPSLYIQPTRIRRDTVGRPGPAGFRLRFRVSPGDAEEFVEGQSQMMVGNPDLNFLGRFGEGAESLRLDADES